MNINKCLFCRREKPLLDLFWIYGNTGRPIKDFIVDFLGPVEWDSHEQQGLCLLCIWLLNNLLYIKNFMHNLLLLNVSEEEFKYKFGKFQRNICNVDYDAADPVFTDMQNKSEGERQFQRENTPFNDKEVADVFTRGRRKYSRPDSRLSVKSEPVLRRKRRKRSRSVATDISSRESRSASVLSELRYDNGCLLNKRTRSVRRLLNIIANKNAEDTYSCTLCCSQDFKDLEELTQHKIDDHKMLAKYWCEECYKMRFTSQEDLDRHNNINHKILILNCPICSQVTQTSEELQKHLYEHKLYSVPCYYCDKCFLSKSIYEKHVRECHKGKKRRIKQSKPQIILDRLDKSDDENYNHCSLVNSNNNNPVKQCEVKILLQSNNVSEEINENASTSTNELTNNSKEKAVQDNEIEKENESSSSCSCSISSETQPDLVVSGDFADSVTPPTDKQQDQIFVNVQVPEEFNEFLQIGKKVYVTDFENIYSALQETDLLMEETDAGIGTDEVELLEELAIEDGQFQMDIESDNVPNKRTIKDQVLSGKTVSISDSLSDIVNRLPVCTVLLRRLEDEEDENIRLSSNWKKMDTTISRPSVVLNKLKIENCPSMNNNTGVRKIGQRRKLQKSSIKSRFRKSKSSIKTSAYTDIPVMKDTSSMDGSAHVTIADVADMNDKLQIYDFNDEVMEDSDGFKIRQYPNTHPTMKSNKDVVKPMLKTKKDIKIYIAHKPKRPRGRPKKQDVVVMENKSLTAIKTLNEEGNVKLKRLKSVPRKYNSVVPISVKNGKNDFTKQNTGLSTPNSNLKNRMLKSEIKKSNSQTRKTKNKSAISTHVKNNRKNKNNANIAYPEVIPILRDEVVEVNL